MSKKIGCGGFRIDDDTLKLKDDGTLYAAGGGVQPDWNQNDSTALDYIKNRPFYIGDTVETVFVQETTVLFSGSGMYSGTIQSTFKPKLGNTYKVSWDGTIYESVCTPAYDDFLIGNTSIVGTGTDTGEPFIMMIPQNEDTITIGTKDTAESHTISISESYQLIEKIPAKFIDKNTSGYIVVHESETMTVQEAESYYNTIMAKQIAFIVWGFLHIKMITVSGSTPNKTLNLALENEEFYSIKENDEGLFNYNDRIFSAAQFPTNNIGSKDEVLEIYCKKNQISISPPSYSGGVGSTNALFTVKSNGTKSKNFDVLGNGEAVTPAVILYSSTANSTKKFRITVDDSGNITATEVTS